MIAVVWPELLRDMAEEGDVAATTSHRALTVSLMPTFLAVTLQLDPVAAAAASLVSLCESLVSLWLCQCRINPIDTRVEVPSTVEFLGVEGALVRGFFACASALSLSRRGWLVRCRHASAVG